MTTEIAKDDPVKQVYTIKVVDRLGNHMGFDSDVNDRDYITRDEDWVYIYNKKDRARALFHQPVQVFGRIRDVPLDYEVK